MGNLILAIEGGATHCTGGLYSARGKLLDEFEGGPCNPIAYGLEASAASLVKLANEMLAGQTESAIAYVGTAGVVNRVYCETLARALCEEANVTSALVAGDLQPLLHANAGTDAGILVIAGTGSNVLAQDGRGNVVGVGGRGALLGDTGSAYAIGARALRAAADAVDKIAPGTTLVAALMRAANAKDFEDLVPWGAHATKADIAALARVVWECADAGDTVAINCLHTEAGNLACHAMAAAKQLGLPGSTPVFGQGGLFQHCGLYRNFFENALKDSPNLVFSLPKRKGHRAILDLRKLDRLPEWAGRWERGMADVTEVLPATERQDTDAPFLDTLDTPDLVARMLEADAGVARAVANQAGPLARAVDLAAAALEQGGRMLYIGAGTSGRLGVLDASECPPTFGTDAGQVVGIIAGGEAALRNSVEGAEDDEAAGAADLASKDVNSRDFVVGIAASGGTPYTLAALALAREQGAKTVLICCNPAAKAEVDVLIAMNTGPEALTGSTRLKAGTATKMALNILSTGAMTRSGYVYQGLMVRMRPVNDKLRARARRIVSTLCNVDDAAAAQLLSRANNKLAIAVVMGLCGLDAAAARARYAAAGGNIARALKPGDP